MKPIHMFRLWRVTLFFGRFGASQFIELRTRKWVYEFQWKFSRFPNHNEK